MKPAAAMQVKTQVADFSQEEKMPICSCPLGIKVTFFCEMPADQCNGKAQDQTYYCLSCITNHPHQPKVISQIALQLHKKIFPSLEQIKEVYNQAKEKFEKFQSIISYFEEVSQNIPEDQRKDESTVQEDFDLLSDLQEEANILYQKAEQASFQFDIKQLLVYEA